MNTGPFVIIICILFILLWLYASVPKLLNIKRFRAELLSQPFPAWMAKMLTWLLPLSELIIIGLLLFARTRLAGLYLSAGLMTAFTIYIAGIVFKVYKSYPCPCGGLFSELGWDKHLKVNLLLTFIAFAGILLIEL